MSNAMQNEVLMFGQSLPSIAENIRQIHETTDDLDLVRPGTTEAFLASSTRRELYSRLRHAYGAIEKNEPLGPETEAKTLDALTKFIEEDEYNERIILYLPSSLIPDMSTPAKDEALRQSRVQFTNTFTQAWNHLLEGKLDAPRDQALALLPIILEKSMLTPEVIIDEYLHHASSLVRASFMKQIPYLIEQEWFSLGQIMTDNQPLERKYEAYTFATREAIATSLITLVESGKMTKETFPH